MNKLMNLDAIPAFLRTLENENLPEKIDAQLPLMLAIINDLLAKIKSSQNIAQANFYFDILQEIQETLCTIAFVKEIPLTRELDKILSDCDRLDDAWTRDMLFKLIKSGNYHLETGVSLFQEGFDDEYLA